MIKITCKNKTKHLNINNNRTHSNMLHHDLSGTRGGGRVDRSIRIDHFFSKLKD